MSDSLREANVWTAPKWASPLTLVLSFLGIGVATYLTYAHYTTAATLACPETGVINCAKVTTSPESEILGVPVALLGLLYFVTMAALCTPWAWKTDQSVVRLVRIAMTIVSVAMVLYLIYVELFNVNAICLYCTAIHITALILFASVSAATVIGTSSDVG